MLKFKISNVNMKGVDSKINRMTNLGQYALAHQMHADMNQYVPAKSYDLRNLSYVSSDNKAIHYMVPYASKQYRTQFTNYTTPGTGPFWDKKAKSIHMRDWVSVVQKAMR